MATTEISPSHRQKVGEIVEYAMSDFIGYAETLVRQGEMTPEEIGATLEATGYPDFAQGWEEWMEESGG